MLRQQPYRVFSLTMILLWGAGCGSRSASTAGDQGSGQTDSAVSKADAALPSNDSGATTSGKCLIVKNTRLCCASWVAIDERSLTQDPCTISWPNTMRDPSCQPMPCLADCAEVFEPPTRVVAKGSDGTCAFVDECQDDKDCALGVNAAQCCSCPTAFPSSVIQREACIAATHNGAPIPAATPRGCNRPTCDLGNCPPCAVNDDLPFSLRCLAQRAMGGKRVCVVVQ
ncbi:MAG: hypothetical protein H6707_01795 [Deltaproteobacteria bacterium]|nr:hypothetical protein [Deltaproteobacteria bacterium]